MDLGEVKTRMTKAVDFARGDIATIRTGRATSALVENIVVGAYGGTARMRVVELATISVTDAQTIVITPYDQSIIGDVKRDVEAANVGLSPVIDNNLIRIAVPSLTAERRLEYVKLLHTKLEDGRVKVRQIRHDKMTELKRQGEAREINEDEQEKAEEDLQKMTDETMAEIEKIGKIKEEELVTV
ncbi:MAG: Ribosome-recycling factor [Candidatus Gottesmanbacteria bacterium GW2011_GWA1_48_13]|uniref:Ribosome-recycling factor n=1 Tax=Candidatus Gottesmanbacteria bacterium GW2011_GWA1_48_13 TaxID=1618439 RepID=A0A0G1UMQ5_9BACT|nr:MAG: Ribosome-recycling factor [Candidatus Gottesmanbacteria bacterium GW2011_GWA1_48_13]